MTRRRATVGGVFLVATLLLAGGTGSPVFGDSRPMHGVRASRARAEHKILTARERIRTLRLGQRTTEKEVLRVLGRKRADLVDISTGCKVLYYRVGTAHRLLVITLSDRLVGVILTGE